ncbi:MAG TPA: trehalose-6-phosphate synthase, partial [Longimicrobiaceae bacterium]|nr:trehalose-6-phosphate synthase [Longimicrobiaceae bacterium]
PEKLKALELLWERYPELRGRFTYVQVAVPTRSDIQAYDALAEKVERQVWEINERFGDAGWRPVHVIRQSLPPDRLAVLYRLADVCIVGSLQDGMNLVAKEYVASKPDGDGVLVLSEFAGAAEEMRAAVLVNPYDPEDFARRVRDALTMPPGERRVRMDALRGTMRSIFDWMHDVFAAWGAVAGALAGQGAEEHAEFAIPAEMS